MKKLICVLFLVTEIFVFGCATNSQTAKPETEDQVENIQEVTDEVDIKKQEKTQVENSIVVEEKEEEQKPADTKDKKGKHKKEG